MTDDRALPIEPILPELRRSFSVHSNVVLQAPPGAGKTTFVPLALIDEPWLDGRSIVMLEPRRLATRAAARRLAELRGEAVGGLVGYRMRLEQRVSPRTRIEVVTEGILTRRLQGDPTLEGVGLVIFDEFHERSLNADLGLALVLRSQQLVREDLRILVMSATLDGEAVARLVGGAPVVTSAGRSFPVETYYVEPRAGQRLEAATVAVATTALHRHAGDLLVFLPGAAEIRRAESLLADASLGPTVIIAPLHGTMPQDAQDRALRPAPPGARKIVLATSIAETSLTIQGVGVVIDGGRSRAPRFSPRSGMTRLETVRLSQASADQRRGRAGRLAPGVCYRLWPEHEPLLPASPPEIMHADLAPLALDLSAAGVADPGELRWIDPPPPAAFAQARELLVALEAIDDRGQITGHGREMSALPAHPRLAHMLLRAKQMGAGSLACDIAALLADRDVLQGDGAMPPADLGLRLDALRSDGADRLVGGARIDRDAVRRARDESARLAKLLDVRRVSVTSRDPGILLALAYPDRVGQLRPGEGARYLLRNGRGAAFDAAQSFGNPDYIVVAALDDRRPEGRIFIATAVSLEELREQFGSQIEHEQVVEWRDDVARVIARDRERLGALVLRDAPYVGVDPEQVTRALIEEVRRRGVTWLGWTDAADRLRRRIAFAGSISEGWPDVSDGGLIERIESWLTPRLAGATRLDDVRRVNLSSALTEMLDWMQRRALDDLAPTHIEVPSGSRIPIDYSDPMAPTLSVRIQEMFGATETPRVGGGRIPLTIHLLSPAHRPVQVTRDLAGFWRTSYFDVRRDLRGRYPKHDWPEDPLGKRAKR